LSVSSWSGSTQVDIAIGCLRGGVTGAVAAWLGLTLPSTLLLIGFAYGFDHLEYIGSAKLLHGLMLASVAVVAQAVWPMGRTLCPDKGRVTIAVVAASLVVILGPVHGQIFAIVLAGAWGACIPENVGGHPAVSVWHAGHTSRGSGLPRPVHRPAFCSSSVRGIDSHLLDRPCLKFLSRRLACFRRRACRAAPATGGCRTA